MNKLFLIYCMLLSQVVLFTQTYDADEILEKVKSKINSVEDYSANVTIKVDVNFLKVPESHAKLYFKQPDKIKMESEGFALLPRQGLNFSPIYLLKEDYKSLYAKEDSIDGYKVHLIKILPLSDSSNVILSNLFIDQNEFIVRKIETTTKNSGTVTLELNYKEEAEHALPSEMKITFKVEQMNLPPGMTGEFEANQETQKDGKLTGSVIVVYENYNVNSGLSDEFFEDDN